MKKLIILVILVLMIGSAILDLEVEKKRPKIIPSLNPFYYYLKNKGKETLGVKG